MRFYLFGSRRILGMRAGVSFSPSDFKAEPSVRQGGTASFTGSFVYVIRAADGHCKVGVTKDPAARLATLQTGSATVLSYAFLGVTPGEGRNIERQAHTLLGDARLTGEWFSVAPELAVSAVMGAAAKLGEPVQAMSLEQAAATVLIASNANQKPSYTERSNRVFFWLMMIAAIAVPAYGFASGMLRRGDAAIFIPIFWGGIGLLFLIFGRR